MSNFDSDGSPEQEWDDRGELAWNEFDWERYLREQDQQIQRYLHHYETCRDEADRIDAVAEKMGWGVDASDLAGDEAELTDDEVYTLHKNPIFIATKAIALGLRRSWERVASDPGKVPQPLAISFLASLQRAEEQATQAVHALDFGDYAMAVSLFKRALAALNASLALLNADTALRHRAVAEWRETSQPQLFDLREIWLRVMAECREELELPDEGES